MGRRGISLLLVFASVVLLGFGLYEGKKLLVILPGTEPGTVAAADNVLTCKQCHHSTLASRPVAIYDDWSGSMMAHSARDPIFYAALAVANKYNSVTGQVHGEYCIRCHSPNGWLAGHSEDYTGQSLTGTDFDGVQCDYCHRAIDPVHPDSGAPHLNSAVPGYGNGMHVFQQYSTPKRGPYDSVAAPHATRYYSFLERSDFCGVCHDVSNPFYAKNAAIQSPHEYAPLERTYSEWFMSWYATQGDSGTCQSCHMTDTTGYACVYLNAPLRDDIAKHDLTGGNTFVPDILAEFDTLFNTFSHVDTIALARGKQRAISTLQRAADLSVVAHRTGDTVVATARITNLTGHKLPTGYPDGRRMWLNVVGLDAKGDTVFESGRYATDTALLVRDPQIKVYEAIQGLTGARGLAYGLPAGASFHFVLNDTVLFDNRIPPRGFDNVGFQSRFAEPVGVTYADSQFWDNTRYVMPATTSEVIANLYYQTISKEYIDFLKIENEGNVYDWQNWAGRLYSAWQRHGKSQPTLMNSTRVLVQSASADVSKDGVPAGFELMQNYPNPFNPNTVIRYSLSVTSTVTLKIVDLLGQEVALLVKEVQPPGNHEATWNARDIPTGIYFYSLAAGRKTQTRKLILVR